MHRREYYLTGKENRKLKLRRLKRERGRPKMTRKIIVEKDVKDIDLKLRWLENQYEQIKNPCRLKMMLY